MKDGGSRGRFYGGAGNVCSTARDLLRWQDALFGGKVLSPAGLAAMITPGTLADGSATSYGSGLLADRVWQHPPDLAQRRPPRGYESRARPGIPTTAADRAAHEHRQHACLASTLGTLEHALAVEYLHITTPKARDLPLSAASSALHRHYATPQIAADVTVAGSHLHVKIAGGVDDDLLAQGSGSFVLAKNPGVEYRFAGARLDVFKDGYEARDADCASGPDRRGARDDRRRLVGRACGSGRCGPSRSGRGCSCQRSSGVRMSCRRSSHARRGASSSRHGLPSSSATGQPSPSIAGGGPTTVKYAASPSFAQAIVFAPGGSSPVTIAWLGDGGATAPSARWRRRRQRRERVDLPEPVAVVVERPTRRRARRDRPASSCARLAELDADRERAVALGVVDEPRVRRRRRRRVSRAAAAAASAAASAAAARRCRTPGGRTSYRRAERRRTRRRADRAARGTARDRRRPPTRASREIRDHLARRDRRARRSPRACRHRPAGAPRCRLPSGRPPRSRSASAPSPSSRPDTQRAHDASSAQLHHASVLQQPGDLAEVLGVDGVERGELVAVDIEHARRRGRRATIGTHDLASASRHRTRCGPGTARRPARRPCAARRPRCRTRRGRTRCARTRPCPGTARARARRRGGCRTRPTTRPAALAQRGGDVREVRDQVRLAVDERRELRQELAVAGRLVGRARTRRVSLDDDQPAASWRAALSARGMPNGVARSWRIRKSPSVDRPDDLDDRRQRAEDAAHAIVLGELRVLHQVEHDDVVVRLDEHRRASSA